jgi:hypothetical protein
MFEVHCFSYLRFSGSPFLRFKDTGKMPVLHSRISALLLCIFVSFGVGIAIGIALFVVGEFIRRS